MLFAIPAMVLFYQTFHGPAPAFIDPPIERSFSYGITPTIRILQPAPVWHTERLNICSAWLENVPVVVVDFPPSIRCLL
jgi:hypothetical protein